MNSQEEAALLAKTHLRSLYTEGKTCREIVDLLIGKRDDNYIRNLPILQDKSEIFRIRFAAYLSRYVTTD
jgi:hypothetical protein